MIDQDQSAEQEPVQGGGAGAPELPQSDPDDPRFTPEVLDKTVIAIPLLKEMEATGPGRPIHVIIDLNLEYPGKRTTAREHVTRLIELAIGETGGDAEHEGADLRKSELTQQYLFARLSADAIRALVRLDAGDPPRVTPGDASVSTAGRAIYRIWSDSRVRAFINRSVSTVKADAARAAFSALGKGIVWAVMDSGIDAGHPHFAAHRNLELDAPLDHSDFTVLDPATGAPTSDPFQHGTHVAGILAGESRATPEAPLRVLTRLRDENGKGREQVVEMTTGSMTGMAPECKLLSLKVLDDAGDGRVSNLIAAIAYIQDLNGHGRRIRVHGVNMSVGYDFEPEWFACGQSPLCVEVDRLVRSGVVVVVAAGNTGYGVNRTSARGQVAGGLDVTINDPGNAELAITVGSTHRDMPHVYGVSYFSSKGPTGDGRMKPDVVAPGEKIVSAAAHRQYATKDEAGQPKMVACDYREDSGTSMAAPHVSGAIAAFLSIRGEFVGQPERLKQIFLSTATDLNRDRYFQGRGLVDLMRAIQSV